MPQIPSEKLPDSTLPFMLDPYRFILRRCREHGTELFQTRILLQKTICMTGQEAAELVYDRTRFTRAGAAPLRVQKTLFGKGGVQSLDGERHLQRKQMFLSLMTPEHIQELVNTVDREWHDRAQRWKSQDQVVLYDESRELLTRAVCAWAGVPLEESEVAQRTQELTALFDQAGSIGPKHWWSRLARKKSNEWAGNVIDQIRSRRLNPPENSAAHVIAFHRDSNGEQLDRHTAAVELLNILRPTVAVAVYFLFIALALHEHPEARRRLRAGEEGYDEPFIQEVRRFYPFFPAIMARVREDFEWKGYPFPQGTRVMLDLYGTNRDPRSWENPDEFRPERFHTWDGSPFNFIPQGGGDHHHNHRCPGEWITIELMKNAASFLARKIEYDVPEQDLGANYADLPAKPPSGFIIRNVRNRETA